MLKVKSCTGFIAPPREISLILGQPLLSTPDKLDCFTGHKNDNAARGYVLEPGCAVKTLDLQNGIAKLDDPAIILSSDVSDEWLSAFWQMSDIDERKKGTAEQMLLNIVPPKASRIDLGRREGDHSVRDGGPARRVCRPVRHCDGQGFPQTGLWQAAGIGLASMGEGERSEAGLPPGHIGQRSGSQSIFRPGVHRSLSVLVSDQEIQLAASCVGMRGWANAVAPLFHAIHRVVAPAPGLESVFSDVG